MERKTFEEIDDHAMQKDESSGKLFGYYGYVASNGYNMNKEDLVTIIKELDYVLGQKLSAKVYNNIVTSSLLELEERVKEEEE